MSRSMAALRFVALCCSSGCRGAGRKLRRPHGSITASSPSNSDPGGGAKPVISAEYLDGGIGVALPGPDFMLTARTSLRRRSRGRPGQLRSGGATVRRRAQR